MAIGGFELLTKGLEMEKAKAQRLDGSADPISQALAKISKGDSDDAKYRLSAIADQMAAGNIDDLSRLLAEQAALLNFVFAQSVVDASNSGSAEDKTKLLSMALRAQNASRKTVVTLHHLKNPKRTTFIKNQQNNLVAGDAVDGSAKMDTRTKGLASSTSPAVETVGKVHRAKDTAGKSRSKAKRANSRATGVSAE